MKKSFAMAFIMLNFATYGQIPQHIFNRNNYSHEYANIIDLNDLYLIYNDDRYNIDTIDVKADSGLFEIMWFGRKYMSDTFKLVGLSKADTTHTNYIVLLGHDELYLLRHNVGDTISLIVRRMYKILQKSDVSSDGKARNSICDGNDTYILRTGKKRYKIRCPFLYRLIATAKPISILNE